MKVLIKRATIVSTSSPFHGKLQDIFIEDGMIASIADEIKKDADQTIAIDDLHVSVGWMDCFANFCDPGQEFKETVASGANAAAAGGYTAVMLIPNTQPVISGKSQVEYLQQKRHGLPVKIFPIGSVTKNTEGKELTEMYDMFDNGAVAFSDGLHPVQSSGILQKALEYVLAIDAVIIQLPDDKTIGTSGLMNEGSVSTKMGLAGKPALAEELMIARDIELVKYTKSKIHFTGVSTAKSLALIAAAKNEGLRVTCSVTPYHLFFCEDDLLDYDTNLKVNPPLRSSQDSQALRDGIKSGVVDFIASHHQPQDWDSKICEFEYAKNGMEGLETVFGSAGKCGVSVTDFVQMQSETIRKIFSIDLPILDQQQPANLTMFLPHEGFTFEEAFIKSKSKNNPFVGKRLLGRVIGIINGNTLVIN